MNLDFSPFESALSSLEKALMRAHQNLQDEEIRDACIQRFEYSYELAWKMLKRQLEKEEGSAAGIDALSKKQLFRLGVEKGLLESVEPWFIYLEKRNLTVHTYDEDNATEVFESLDAFLKDAQRLLTQLKARHD